MFKLYRFENMLYSMELTGKEIDLYLEYAAGIWFNTMTGPGDHLLLFNRDPDASGRLANPYCNFSSAASLNYEIDVQRPPGDRVTILGFSNGAPFVEASRYRVAINSYRGNGGGGHLTRGAGIPAEELSGQITWSTDIDLRYYLMEHLSSHDTLHPVMMDNWRCIPVDWVRAAFRSDSESIK